MSDATTTPSKPEASLRELRNEIDSIRDRLMVYGISGERLYGIDEWSEPAVRLAKVIERLDALSARDEAGAVCGACGDTWTGQKCGQAENGHAFPVCYPVATPPAASGDEWVLELIDRLKGYAVNFPTFTLADAGKVDEARDLIRRLAAVAPAGMKCPHCPHCDDGSFTIPRNPAAPTPPATAGEEDANGNA